MSSDLKVFNKLHKALAYKQNAIGTTVFSWELNKSGSRRYFVSKKEKVWPTYKDDTLKNLYEVISEGHSKLYFDLEFLKLKENSNKNGEVMTKRLVNEVNDYLKRQYNQQNRFEDVLILDSSNEDKFSVHLIFKKIYFSDNRKIKHFLQDFEGQLSDETRKLFQIINRGSPSSFIDTNVYNRNQCFRLFLSTKFGKSTPLKVARYDRSVNEISNSDDVLYDIFSSSLITNIDIDSSHMIEISTLPVQFKEDQFVESSAVSPYPELDEFVKSQLQSGGFIRQCKVDKSWENKVLYVIGGNRFCSIAGREHKSNHIYYVCDIFNMTMNQYCHSSACVGSKAADVYIPEAVTEWIKDFDEPFP